MMYSARLHLNVNNHYCKSANVLTPGDPHCAKKEDAYLFKVLVSLTLWLARKGFLFSIPEEYQTMRTEGWMLEWNTAFPGPHLHWALIRCHALFSSTCNMNWQLRIQQPVVSQRLPCLPLPSLFGFFTLFSLNTSSMGTTRQWCLEDEGRAMAGRQKVPPCVSH